MKVRVRPKHGYKRHYFVEVEVDTTDKCIVIKEKVREQNVKCQLKELFFNNELLDEDKSLAYYNIITDGAIVETCSNPKWAAMLYSIIADYEERHGRGVRQAPLYRYLKVLFSSNPAQPKYCPTLEDWSDSIDPAPKLDGAYADLLRHKIREYEEYAQPGIADPLSEYIKNQRTTKNYELNQANNPPTNKKASPTKPRASRGREYIPTEGSVAYALLLTLHEAYIATPPRASLSEEEITQLAQYYTYTDITEKGAAGFKGFDAMESTLIPKKVVHRESSGMATRYSLSVGGRNLAKACYDFYIAYKQLKEQAKLPYQVPNNLTIKLIIDTKEPVRLDIKEIFLREHVPFEIRKLPVGDFVWVAKSGDIERVLPFVIERKTYLDFDNSLSDGRYHKQKKRMMACGLPHLGYLLEGAPISLKVRKLPNHEDRVNEIETEFQNTLLEGFMTICTQSLRATVVYLMNVTFWLQKKYSRVGIPATAPDFRVWDKHYKGEDAVPCAKPTSCLVWPAEGLVKFIMDSQYRATVNQEFPQGGLILVHGMKEYVTTRQRKLNQTLRQLVLETPTANFLDTLKGEVQPNEVVSDEIFSYWRACILTQGWSFYNVETEVHKNHIVEKSGVKLCNPGNVVFETAAKPKKLRSSKSSPNDKSVPQTDYATCIDQISADCEDPSITDTSNDNGYNDTSTYTSTTTTTTTKISDNNNNNNGNNNNINNNNNNTANNPRNTMNTTSSYSPTNNANSTTDLSAHNTTTTHIPYTSTTQTSPHITPQVNSNSSKPRPNFSPLVYDLTGDDDGNEEDADLQKTLELSKLEYEREQRGKNTSPTITTSTTTTTTTTTASTATTTTPHLTTIPTTPRPIITPTSPIIPIPASPITTHPAQSPPNITPQTPSAPPLDFEHEPMPDLSHITNEEDLMKIIKEYSVTGKIPSTASPPASNATLHPPSPSTTPTTSSTLPTSTTSPNSTRTTTSSTTSTASPMELSTSPGALEPRAKRSKTIPSHLQDYEAGFKECNFCKAMYFGDNCNCPQTLHFLASNVKSENEKPRSSVPVQDSIDFRDPDTFQDLDDTAIPDVSADEEFARKLQAELNGDHYPPSPPKPASTLPDPKMEAEEDEFLDRNYLESRVRNSPYVVHSFKPAKPHHTSPQKPKTSPPPTPYAPASPLKRANTTSVLPPTTPSRSDARPLSSSNPAVPQSPVPQQPATPSKRLVRCGACGGEGHTRNNRICPMYEQVQKAKEDKARQQEEEDRQIEEEAKKRQEDLQQMLRQLDEQRNKMRQEIAQADHTSATFAAQLAQQAQVLQQLQQNKNKRKR